MSSTSLQGYPKSRRLLNKKDFDTLKIDSVKAFAHPIICYSKSSDKSRNYSRIGFSVSKKIGLSHERNRLKRILKELFRKDSRIKTVSKDLLIVIIKKPDSEDQLLTAFKKILALL